MKVLILNGSPHKDGDTGFIVNKVKERFPKDTIIEEIYAYHENIKACLDCRYCWKNKGCAIHDKMDIILKDDYDVLIIASPVYMSYVTPPLFSIITRLNYIWSNKFFLNIQNDMKKKKGMLILVGGGNGGPEGAISISKTAFKFLNAEFNLDKNYIYSLNTDTILAKDDESIDEQIDNVMSYLLN